MINVKCPICRNEFVVESYYNNVLCPMCNSECLSPFKSWLNTRGKEIIKEMRK